MNITINGADMYEGRAEGQTVGKFVRDQDYTERQRLLVGLAMGNRKVRRGCFKQLERKVVAEAADFHDLHISVIKMLARASRPGKDAPEYITSLALRELWRRDREQLATARDRTAEALAKAFTPATALAPDEPGPEEPGPGMR